MTLNSYFSDYRDVGELLQVALAILLAWSQAAPVARVEVRGVSRVETNDVIRVAGLAPGTPADKAAAAAAAERLMATGWFERVNYRLQPGPEGVVVTFIVVERPPEEAPPPPPKPKPRISAVSFAGNKEAPSGILWQAIRGVAENREYEEEDFRHILDSLLRPVFAERGVWQVKFGAIEVTGDDPVYLKVNIDEGPVLTLAGVLLDNGDKTWVDEARFPVGLTANRRRIEEAMTRFRHRLAREGYLRAFLLAAEQVQDSVVYIHLMLTPGERHAFGELRIRGLAPEEEARARKLWNVKPGATANPDVVEAFIKAVFEARIPKGANALRQLAHRSGEAVVDVEVEFR